MRRNIAKVSALIMAATTTMSPMMPAATTVAWAGEVATASDSVVKDVVFGEVSDIDWEALTIPYEYTVNGVTRTGNAAGELIPATKCGEIDKVQFAVTVDNVVYHSVAFDVKGAKALEHAWTEAKEEIVTEPTCTLPGYYNLVKYCTRCNQSEIVEANLLLPKLGHDWSADVIDETAENVNILKDANGKFVLDAAGKPQAADKTEYAYYTVKRTCKRDNAVETEKLTIAPTSASRTVIVTADHQEDSAYANLNLPKIDNTVLVDGKAVLDKCEKDGTYLVVKYAKTKNDSGKEVEEFAGYDVETIAAHHIWSDNYYLLNSTEYKEYDADTLALFKAGKITVTYDKAGNPVVKNSDCYRTATVKLAQKCTKDGVVNEETAKLVTVEPTGDHKYSQPKADTENPEYTVTNDGAGHSYNRYKECVVCGDKVDVEAGYHIHVANDKLTRKENIVEPTCTEEGSYELVTYCKDCGYVFSTKSYTVPVIDHKYGDVAVETDGEYIVNGEKAVTFTLYQNCVDCGANLYENANTITVNKAKVNEAFTDEASNAITLKDGSKVYVVAGEVEKSEYKCTPDQITIKVVTCKETGLFPKHEKDVVLKEFTVPYYADLEAYKNRGEHVAAAPVTEEKEDGTHKVTYCKYGCGTVMSDELVEPEKTLGQVEGLKAAVNANGQVEVSWDALEGADGYLVVAINGKVRGQQIGYTAGTSFVDKDANSKDYNYYWVIPYFKNADGKIVKGQLTGYVYAMKQTEFAAVAESTEDGVALTWEAVEGASKYIVKAKAASEKTATAIATVEGTEYVDATASADEYTFYWVFPVYTNAAGKDVVGNASNYVFGMTK